MSPRLSSSPPASFAKVTGRPSHLVLSSPGFHFCEILVPHVPNNDCRYPRELLALNVLCILGLSVLYVDRVTRSGFMKFHKGAL